MAELSTEYRGYIVRYSENTDTWTCLDLDVDAATLSKAKDKINRVLRDHRKAAAVELFRLRGPSSAGFDTVRAIDHKTRPQSKYDRSTGAYQRFTEHQIGYMGKSGRGRERKSWSTLDRLAIPSDEVTKAIGEHAKRVADVEAATELMHQAYRNIPRATVADFKDLIAACKPETETS